MSAPQQEPSVALMLSGFIEKGVTSENVAAFSALIELKERLDNRAAEREFAAAFHALQGDIPTIMGARPIPDRNGNVKFHYANFDDIDAIVRPICLRHGFSYSFREGMISEGRVTVIMTLTHKGGHYRDIPYSCRIGSGPPGANESQADGSGHSYAQRGAIESGLALRIVGQREDAKNLGAPITQEQADTLRDLCDDSKSDRTKFLAHAGAPSFEEISDTRFEDLCALLRRRLADR